MNNSEQHRRACEARQVLKMSKEKRQEYYKGVKHHRGEAGAKYLIEEVNRQYRIQNNNQEMEM